MPFRRPCPHPSPRRSRTRKRIPGMRLPFHRKLLRLPLPVIFEETLNEKSDDKMTDQNHAHPDCKADQMGGDGGLQGLFPIMTNALFATSKSGDNGNTKPRHPSASPCPEQAINNIPNKRSVASRIKSRWDSMISTKCLSPTKSKRIASASLGNLPISAVEMIHPPPLCTGRNNSHVAKVTGSNSNHNCLQDGLRSSLEEKKPCRQNSQRQQQQQPNNFRSSLEARKPCRQLSDEMCRSSLEAKKPCRQLSNVNVQPAQEQQQAPPSDQGGFRSSVEARKPLRRLSGEVNAPIDATTMDFRSSIEAKKPCRQPSAEKSLSLHEISQKLLAEYVEDLTGRRLELRQTLRQKDVDENSLQTLIEYSHEFSFDLENGDFVGCDPNAVEQQ